MMNCKIAQRQMALAVGEDLDAATTQALQSHLTDCPPCRTQWEQHQRSFAMLQSSQAALPVPRRESVWPTVAARLQERAAAPRRGEFNGWIAALAVTAACVVVFVFSQDGRVPAVNHRDPSDFARGQLVPGPASIIDDSFDSAAQYPEANVPDSIQRNATKKKFHPDDF